MLAEEKKNKESSKEYQNYWMKLGLKIFVESAGWIALPVVGALYLGRWLDTKYETEPLFFLGITIFAFVISSIGIGMTGVKYMKMIERDEEKKKKESGSDQKGELDKKQ